MSMSLRRGTRPEPIRVWKLRQWLPAVLAAAAGVGVTPTDAPAQQSPPAALRPVAAGGQAPKSDAKVDPKAEAKAEEPEKLFNPQFENAPWGEVLDEYA